MPDQAMTAPTDTKSLTDDDVLEFLRANPNFLVRNPEAVDFLLPPKSVDGGRKVADFQSYLIDRLKADKAEAEEIARDVVEVARHNMNNQSRIQRAVIHLLESETFDDFIQTITMDFSSLLDVDITALVIEADGRDIPHIHTNGIRVVPEGTVDNWMAGKPVLLQDDISGIETIYGPGATLVRSQALVRIDVSRHTPPAIIAFGSRDPHFFHPQQGIEQVGFLARCVERLLRSWLTLPA